MRNAAHEQRVAQLIWERHPELFVTASSGVSARVGEYERTMTGVINSYIGPLMKRVRAGDRARGDQARLHRA